MTYLDMYLNHPQNCCCSATKLCPNLCDPMGCSPPRSSVLHYHWKLLKFMSIKSVMLSNHLILCCPLLLPPSIFPSIRVFSSESVLLFSWLKYWIFSSSISPSNVYSGLISFRMDCFALLAVQDSQESSPTIDENINSSALSLLYGPSLTSIHDHWKNHSFD